MSKKVILYGLLAVGALFLVMQIVPFGKDHTNPPVAAEPKWDSPQTRALAKRACFDCHSNESVWPWYSNVAPVSWLVYLDVVEARDTFNFSDWAQASKGQKSLVRVINEGEMPPAKYLALHPNARLTAEEKQQLVAGIQKSVP